MGLQGITVMKETTTNKNIEALRHANVLHKHQIAMLYNIYPDLTTWDITTLKHIMSCRFYSEEGYVYIGSENLIKKWKAITEKECGYSENKTYSVEKALTLLMQKIPGLIIETTPWEMPENGEPGECRKIISIVMPPALIAILYPKTEDNYLKDGLVNIATGKVIPISDINKFQDTLLNEIDKVNANAPHPWLVELLYILNHQSTRLWNFDKDRIEDVRRDMFNIDNGLVAKSYLSMLENIICSPRPLYTFSEKTMRPCPHRASILTLPTIYRNYLTPEAIDVDLKSAQAACIARIWNTPLLLSILLSDESLWDYICDRWDIELPKERKKKLAKTAFYSVDFGSRIQSLFHKQMNTRGQEAEARDSFMKIDVIDEIYKARELRYNAIRNGELEIVDAFGRELAKLGVKNSAKATRSIMAIEMQSLEQSLLVEVFRDLAKYKNSDNGWNCIAMQSDGFSFVAHKRRNTDTVLRRLQKLVDEKAKKLGIITKLEVKPYNPEMCNYSGTINKR